MDVRWLRLVWIVVDAIKLYQAGLSLGLQASSLAGQMCMAPGELAGRAATVFTQALPVLYGGTYTHLLDFRMNTGLSAGSTAVGWMVSVALGGMLVRLAWMWSKRPRFDSADAFFVYLALIGVFTAAAYPLVQHHSRPAAAAALSPLGIAAAGRLLRRLHAA